MQQRAKHPAFLHWLLQPHSGDHRAADRFCVHRRCFRWSDMGSRHRLAGPPSGPLLGSIDHDRSSCVADCGAE